MASLAVLPRSAPPGPERENGRPAVLVVDDRRRCIEVNPEACALLGLEREEVLGGRIDRLLAVEMRDRLDHFWRAFREGGGHAGPFRLAAPGGVAAVELSVTENLIPGRHMVAIADAGERLPTPEPRADAAGGAIDGNRRAGSARRPSPREREVLALLATGATDPQIAERLGLSPATVQTHVRNAKAKLGARTRAQAVALSIRRGLIALDW